MDEAERRRILDEAYQNIERLSNLSPRERDPLERLDLCSVHKSRSPRREDELTEYERSAAATRSWQSWVGAEIRQAMTSVALGVAEEVRGALDQIDEQIHRRDDKLKKLELKLVQAQAEIARLKLRMAESDVERGRREREWMPAPNRREQLN
jgi:hypothetical protein